MSNELSIGPHIDKVYEKNKNMYENIKSALDYIYDNTGIKFNVISMFVFGPRSYTETLTEEDKKYIPALNLGIYVHNSYITPPWKMENKAIKGIVKQLILCDTIKASGFIIHLTKLDVENTITIMNKLLSENSFNTRIYLEIPALKPENSIYHNPSMLNELFKQGNKQFGICIDTAHLWSCGVDISDYKSAELWLSEIEIDPEYLLFHCNDNEKNKGQAPDEHSALFEGKIWSKYKDNLTESGLFTFIKYAKNNNIPVILERKPAKLLINDYVNIRQLI